LRPRPQRVKIAHSSTSSSCSSTSELVNLNNVFSTAPTDAYDVSRSGSDEAVMPVSGGGREGKDGRRLRTISASKSEDHVLTTESGKVSHHSDPQRVIDWTFRGGG